VIYGNHDDSFHKPDFQAAKVQGVKPEGQNGAQFLIYAIKSGEHKIHGKVIHHRSRLL
jgi:hypothetical protein